MITVIISMGRIRTVFMKAPGLTGNSHITIGVYGLP